MLTRLYWSAALAFYLLGQARLPFKPLAVVRRQRDRRARAIAAYAYRYVPYYRETMNRLGLRPADLQTADDLERLPLLEREALQRDPEYFVSTAQPLDSYLLLRSGGSSGAPRRVYHDTRALFQNAAHGERERSIITALVGRPVGYRETDFVSAFGSEVEIQAYCRARAFFPRGVRIERQYLPLVEPPEVNAPRLLEFQPEVIHSYGSYLAAIFPYLQATGRSLTRAKVVTYSSDDLPDSARQLITRAFGLPVLSTYESIEAFKIGFECPAHVGLHLNIDLYPVRIVDDAGRTVPDGASGDVVLSNLVNHGTVLLNYRLGDVASLLPQPCPCGRSLPLLSFPQGRSDDWIELEGGRAIHPQSVRTIFTDEEQIWQYQVVQLTSTHFRVAIVASPECAREQIEARVRARFGQTFGPAVLVDVAFVPSIGRTSGGKSRPVISLRTHSGTEPPRAAGGTALE